MTNLSIFRQDEVIENKVIRSRVAKTQQPDAERLRDLRQPITSSDARCLRGLDQPNTSRKARDLRGPDQPNTSRKARGLRDFRQSITTNEARSLRGHCQSTNCAMDSLRINRKSHFLIYFSNYKKNFKIEIEIH